MSASTPITTSITRITWTVPSARIAGATYTVTADGIDAPLRCTCPDHTYRGRNCKHIKAAAAGTAGRPVVRATQRHQRPRRPISEETAAIVAALDI